MLPYRPRAPLDSSIGSIRPRTPPRSTLERTDSGPSREATETRDQYIPNLFDLVMPSRDAASLTTLYVPAVFLQAEAVDSSVLLGNGASFSASLQKIPEGPQRVEGSTIDMGGWSVTKSEPAPPRPKYVVYKVARVAFKENGEPYPDYHRALQSVLTEYHALIYPPLFHHANIIDFLGFAWGSNPFSPAHKLPAIVVEYAEHGTLADVLRRDNMIDLPSKHTLCLDIARGLAALHEAGLVHGDVKAENVLVCSRTDRKFIAKIADFGFSIVEATEDTDIWIGGTNPWRAPETKRAIEVKYLKYTDTYSLGLLIWLICIDGRWPFDFLISGTVSGAARNAEIERLKQSDELLATATSKRWLMSWLRVRFDSSLNDLFKIASRMLPNMQRSSAAEIAGVYTTVLESLYAKLYEQTSQQKLIKCLDGIFMRSLQVDSAARDLNGIIRLLEADEIDLVGLVGYGT